MDQKSINKALNVINQWNVFRPAAEMRISPAIIKEAIIQTLDPYFFDKKALKKNATALLAPEAFRVTQIMQDEWAAQVFESIINLYRSAETACPEMSYKICAYSEKEILGALSEHWSILYLEVNKDELTLEEFRHEVFRNIGAIIESYLFPHLKDLLCQVRLIRGKRADYRQIIKLKLGNIVNELFDTLDMPEIVSPPPWGIRVNQWRNMAQHYKTKVKNNLIYGYYGEPPNENEIVLKREELKEVFKRVYYICNAANTARTLYFIDNLEKIHVHLPNDLEIRTDANILSIGTAISTQGFELIDLKLDTDKKTIVATVRDMTNEPYKERMIHASQFVYPIWSHFPNEKIIVKYEDRNKILRLTTIVKGKDCKKIADGIIPFSDLANLVELHIETKGGSVSS